MRSSNERDRSDGGGVGISRRAVVFGLLPAVAGGAARWAAADDAPKIAPAPAGDRPLTTVAFGACLKLDRPLKVWDAITATKPELFLFLGDTIYQDTVEVAEKRAEYARLAAAPEFARFRATVPIRATWDDHDYGANDGGADYPIREAAQKVFVEFFDEGPDDPRRARPGIYNAHTFGPAGRRTQVILLDTRYFRSPLVRDEARGGYLPNRDPKATMLGEAQWKWLAEELRKPAELRLICSSTPVLHEEQLNEKWANLPRERARLFKTIADAKAGGVVLLSGDRHRGEMSAADVGVGYTVYEVTSSGLNCPYEAYDEPNRHRVGDVLWTDNFGLVRVDWGRGRVALEVRKGDGGEGLKRAVELNALR